MRNNLWTKGFVFGILALVITSGIIIVAPVVKADLTDGLVTYWNFDEGSRNTTYDNSGNGHNGTIYNASWTTGKFGSALYFDGDYDYVLQNPYNGFPTTQITVAFWMNTSDTVQEDGSAFSYACSNATNELVITNYSNFRFVVHDQLVGTSGISSNDGFWHHIAVTWKSSDGQLLFYRDGVQMFSGTGFTGCLLIPNGSVAIGGDQDSVGGSWESSQFFKGVIDDVRIYNRTLTGDEIHDLFIPSTVYVDDDFDTSTLGWGYDHFSSVQAGIDAVADNGFITVFSGVYNENIILSKNNIQLNGEDKNTTTIDAGGIGHALYIAHYKNNHISNLTIRNASGHGVYIYGNSSTHSWVSENNTLENCIITGNSGNGIYIHPTGYGCRIHDTRIENCVISDNGGNGVYLHAEGNHCSIGYSTNITQISNCVIINNSIDGIRSFAESHHSFISFTKVVNCSITENDGIGINVMLTSDCWNDNHIIYHNYLFDNGQNALDALEPNVSINKWYNEILREGNYWSDYTGVDNDSDGIGDTPYNISGGNNQDLYPLMFPFGFENELPVANAGGPYYAHTGNSITFNGSGSNDTNGTIVGYRWDFTNDGNYDTDWLTSATTTHSYPSAGIYTVKLEVKDNASGTDSDIATAYVTTEGGAIPTAEANGPYSGYVNHPVFFSSAGSVGGTEGTITQWYWTFGDGTVSSQQNPSHIYASQGTFTVTLKVTNNYGNTGTDSCSAKIIVVSPDQILPVADAGGPYKGVVNSPITFDGSGSSDADGAIVSYLWNFGDSTTGTGVSPTHSYTIAGNYTVILTVTDNESLTYSNSTLASIDVSGPPTIVISVDLSNVEPIEEENEKTLPITVFCYHQTVHDIHIEILESSNLTITVLSPNITLNPGESSTILIKIQAPQLPRPGNSEVNSQETVRTSTETLRIQATGDSNITSNTEEINIVVIQKGITPGFELIFVLCAIAIALFLWRKKRSV